MTEADLQLIERELSIQLPDVYRQCLLAYPVPALAGNSDTDLWDDAEKVVAYNKELRAGVPGGRKPWPTYMFAVGGLGSPRSPHAIDLRKPEAPVWWAHFADFEAPGTCRPYSSFTSWIENFIVKIGDRKWRFTPPTEMTRPKTPIELLPHNQFSKLHIREFLPPDQIAEDDTGIEYSPLGFNRCRHLFHGRHTELAFFYPTSPPVKLAGIHLQVGEHFPPEAAQRVLTACAPPLRLGMGEDQIVALFGTAEYSTSGGNHRSLRFRAGSCWPYRLGCGFRASSGLWAVWIVREDFYHGDDDA